MKYLAIVTVALLAGAQVAAAGSTKTCDECKTASEPKLGTGDAAAKCAALKTYIKCLASTTKDADGCASSGAFVTKLKAFNATKNCTATEKLTDVCSCQKKYWDEGGDCSKITVLNKCLDGKTGSGCDGKLDMAAVKTAAANRCTASPEATTPAKETKSSTTKDLNAPEATTPAKGTRSTEAIGLITTILISVLGMFFM